MQHRNAPLPVTRPLVITMLAMFLMVYSPFLIPAFGPPKLRAVMVICGSLLIISQTVRGFVLRGRGAVWQRTLWAAADLLIWTASAWAFDWKMPVTLIGFVVATDVAIAGWPYRSGLWHWLAASFFVTFNPMFLGQSLTPGWLFGYSLQVWPGCLFCYLFLRVVGRMHEAQRLADQARKEAELANRQLQEYAEQVEQLAVMRERNRLARDVHDTIAHGFTSIHMQVELLQLLMRRDPAEAERLLESLKTQVGESLDEVRRSVHALRPLQLEERSGIEGIRRLVEEFGATTGVATDLCLQGDGVALPAAHEICLYRAIQEGLSNAFRHGKARRARVRLEFLADRIVAVVEDDGVGAASVTADGLGILGIRERAAVLGGQVTASTAPTGGFVLQVALPLSGQRMGA